MVKFQPVRSFGQTIEDPWPRHTVDCHCNTPIPDIKEKTIFLTSYKIAEFNVLGQTEIAPLLSTYASFVPLLFQALT
jgi:hypothetical protein